MCVAFRVESFVLHEKQLYISNSEHCSLQEVTIDIWKKNATVNGDVVFWFMCEIITAFSNTYRLHFEFMQLSTPPKCILLHNGSARLGLSSMSTIVHNLCITYKNIYWLQRALTERMFFMISMQLQTPLIVQTNHDLIACSWTPNLDIDIHLKSIGLAKRSLLLVSFKVSQWFFLVRFSTLFIVH